MGAEFASFAKRLGFSGRGPTFRRRSNGNWLVFDLERRRIDPREVGLVHDDPRIEFRVNVGVVSTAVRAASILDRDPAPSSRDATIRGWDESLDPRDPNGWDWFVFDSRDPMANARLADRLRIGIERAVAGLDAGGTSDRALLDIRLRMAGPLENLAPGHAEELLALADSVGDPHTRQRIMDALRRQPLPEPEIDAMGVRRVRPGELWPRIGPRRVTKPRLTRLLSDARSERMQARRQSLAALGALDPTPEITEALRHALLTGDAVDRSIAAVGLGHLADAAPTTWQRVLGLAGEDSIEPMFVGSALVLLERLDPYARRTAAVAAFHVMEQRQPAWMRDIAAYKDKLA